MKKPRKFVEFSGFFGISESVSLIYLYTSLYYFERINILYFFSGIVFFEWLQKRVYPTGIKNKVIIVATISPKIIV